MNALAHLIGQRNSVRRGLMGNMIAALVLCLTLGGSVLISEFYEHLAENISDALLQEAREVLTQVDPRQEHFGLNPNALRFRGVQGAYRYTVFDGTPAPVAGGEDSPAIRAQLATTELGVPRSVKLPGDRLGVALRARVDSVDAIVLVSTFPLGTDETPLQKLVHEIHEEIWWVLLGVVTILGSAALATQRAMASLDAVSEQAHEIGPRAISRRLDTDDIPAEVRPLIDAVNGAFERLDQGYRAQADFSSNVAHEIRTPLAVLHSSVERIADPDLRRSLTEDVRRLDRMFEQLIDLSRADALADNGFEPVDLHALAVREAGDLAAEALRQGRLLSVTGATSARVDGHPGLIAIALRNLVRTALRHTPRGDEIEIEILQDPPGFRVLDRGQGVPDGQKAKLFERFARGTGKDPGNEGSGIGLAIVTSVARAHGAQASLSDRPGGGSVFSVVWNMSA